MTEVIPIREFLKTHTQQEAAVVLGRTQGSIGQMLRNGRDVYIVVEDGVPVSGLEKKYFSPAPAIPPAPPAPKPDANLRKARRLARALLDLCPDDP